MEEIITTTKKQKLIEESDDTKNSGMFDSANLSSADPKSIGRPNLRPKVSFVSVFDPKTLVYEKEYLINTKVKKSKQS